MNQKEKIEEFFNSINEKNFTKAFAYFHNEIDWWILGNLEVSGHRDKRKMELGFKFLFRNFESFKFTLHELTEEKNRVSVIAESIGKHKSGKNYNNHYHFLFYFKDEQFIKVLEYFDTVHAAWIEEK